MSLEEQMIKHDINAGFVHPVRLPLHSLPYADYDSVQQEVQEMLSRGIIGQSESGWSAPIVPVK